MLTNKAMALLTTESILSVIRALLLSHHLSDKISSYVSCRNMPGLYLWVLFMVYNDIIMLYTILDAEIMPPLFVQYFTVCR